MSKKFEIKDGDISDGYHTFDELYTHRIALFLLLVNSVDYPCFIKHEHYKGWDAVYLETPGGQVSYHVPMHNREYLKRAKIVEDEYQYDGHTGDDVVFRLLVSI